MAKKQQTSLPIADSVVQPIVKFDAQKHLLDELIDKGEAPELKSVGYMQIKPGNNWVSYVITTKGREVLKVEISEPDMKIVAEESAKISFVQTFVDHQDMV